MTATPATGTPPVRSAPEAAKLQRTIRRAPRANVPANINVPFLNEVLCDSQVKLARASAASPATTTRAARG